jgi:hypothetical protein
MAKPVRKSIRRNAQLSVGFAVVLGVAGVAASLDSHRYVVTSIKAEKNGNFQIVAKSLYGIGQPILLSCREDSFGALVTLKEDGVSVSTRPTTGETWRQQPVNCKTAIGLILTAPAWNGRTWNIGLYKLNRASFPKQPLKSGAVLFFPKRNAGISGPASSIGN